jgi:hypothetical protein
VDQLFSPHNPFRPPDARWQRAAALLLAGNRCPSRTDDAQTWLAWHFQQGLAACRADAYRDLLTRSYPAMAGAHRGFTAAGSLRRAELEARLLANQADEVIALKCGLTPEAVSSYHDLYFAVRPLLAAEVYIVNVAIGPKAHHGLTAGDYDVLLKIFGYFEGGTAIDLLLDYFANPPVVPASLSLLTDAELESLQAKLELQAKILTLTLPVGQANAATVGKVLALLRERRPCEPAALTAILPALGVPRRAPDSASPSGSVACQPAAVDADRQGGGLAESAGQAANADHPAAPSGDDVPQQPPDRGRHGQGIERDRKREQETVAA